MIIDTHAHLNFNAYREDTDEVIARALNCDIWVINVGSQYKTSKRAIEIAEKYEKGVFAAIGLHPIHLETGLVKIKADPDEIQFPTKEEIFDKKKYRELALSSKKAVAIGEIGLDYYWKPKTKTKLQLFKEKQKNVFIQQLELAQELNLPAIIHCRMAHNELIDALKTKTNESENKSRKPEFKGVIHCFTGSQEHAKEYMNMGFHIGFNGLIFKMNLDEIIRATPLEKILVETDCPYLIPPQAISKNKTAPGRNEPIFIKYIIQKIADIKKLSFEEISENTAKNAKKLFNI